MDQLTHPKIQSCDLTREYDNVVKALEQMETKLRVEKKPHLIERPPPLEANDLKEGNQPLIDDQINDEGNPMAVILDDGATISLKKRNLKEFSLKLFPSLSPSSFSLFNLTLLDVSNNELMDLPGLGKMPNLETLNLERNWFNTLPTEIGKLTKLKDLICRRNFLRPNDASLLFESLKEMKDLRVFDLLYNQKCGRPHHRELIKDELKQLTEVKMTLWEEVGSQPGSYVGKSAAERNPLLLRSQLEPWGTVNLRRRLVQDFGQIPTDAAVVNRAGVMERLLKCYEDEQLADQDGHAKRNRVHMDGVPVDRKMIDDLLVELRAWTNESGKIAKNRERPSISADNYMILRSPKFDETTTETPSSTRASRRSMRKSKKLEKYRKIWELAQEALRKVDPVFADRCTEIAVTYGFIGSPHLDKQNCGPFYGFSLGEFPDGQGGVCVECSARLIAVMNTKNRLGRVDGRYPHWVDQYNEESERYSLIYYETGGLFVKPGPAVFSIPDSM